MNDDYPLDDVLRAWADAGEERLPAPYLAAALAQIEQTPQRGARWAPLEDFLMRFQALAAPVALAAVLVMAIVALALLTGPPNVGPEASPTPVAEEPSVVPSPTPEPTATPTTAPTPTARAILDFSALEGDWEGTIRRGGAGGLEFRVVATIRAEAPVDSPIGQVTQYLGPQTEPFCAGSWLALAADHPNYQVGERTGDTACPNGTVDLTYDPDTGTLTYSYRADHGGAAGFATGELSRVEP